MALMSPARQGLTRVALAHLTKSMLANEAARAHGDRVRTELEGSGSGSGGGGGGGGRGVPAIMRNGGREEDGDDNDDNENLPTNVYDFGRALNKTPLAQTDNAFHSTLNRDDKIICPYVLNRPGPGVEGIEAVLHFGKSVAGHPKIVHGGVTALALDNMLAMALFLKGADSVFTAYLKVDYQAPLPCLTTAVVDVTIDRKEGRKIFVTGRMKSLDGAVQYASAETLIIKSRE